MTTPIVPGRMYKVSGGGSIKGIRFNKNGTTDVLVVPGSKKRNPKKKKNNVKRPKKRANRKPNRKRSTARKNKKRAPKKK